MFRDVSAALLASLLFLAGLLASATAEPGPSIDPDGLSAVQLERGPGFDPNGLSACEEDRGPGFDPNGCG